MTWQEFWAIFSVQQWIVIGIAALVAVVLLIVFICLFCRMLYKPDFKSELKARKKLLNEKFDVVDRTDNSQR